MVWSSGVPYLPSTALSAEKLPTIPVRWPISTKGVAWQKDLPSGEKSVGPSEKSVGPGEKSVGPGEKSVGPGKKSWSLAKKSVGPGVKRAVVLLAILQLFLFFQKELESGKKSVEPGVKSVELGEKSVELDVST